MPEHSEKSPASKPQPTAGTKPRRRWWRRIFRASLILFILLAVFHRPLLETGLRLALIKIAAKHHVTLDVHFSGTFFTNLTVRDIQAVPDGGGETPIEKIAIEAVRLDYSIPMLIRHGVGEFLRSYEIENADLAFVALPSKTPEEHQQKKSVAEDLNNLLGQPALYADRVRIENFNLRVRSEKDVTEVKGVHLLFHPWEPGYLRVEEIKAPGLPVWKNLSAETSYAQRDLFVKNLAFSPEMVIEQLNFDASQRAQNKGSLLVQGSFFGGKAQLSVEGTQLHKQGQNLQNSYDTKLQIDAGGIDLHAAAAYFGAKSVPSMRLGKLATTFRGEPESPRTWAGNLEARVEAIGLDKVTVDSAEAAMTFKNGHATISGATVTAGRNVLQLSGDAALPESINDFSKTDGAVKFHVGGPDLRSATAAFLPNQPIAGALTVDGNASLHSQVISADATLDVADVAGAQFAVNKAGLKVHAVKRLDAPDQPVVATIDSQLSGNVFGLRFNTFTVDSVALDAETKGDLVTLRKADVNRAESNVSVHGTYRIPQSGGDPLKTPMDVQFAISAPKLESFGISVKDTVFGGHVEGAGNLQSGKEGLGGNIKIEGGDFTLGDFKAQRFGAKINVANNEASIEQFEFQVDGANQVSVAGKAGLQAPNAYEGAVFVLFKNLAVLHPLLEALGIHEEIAGAVDCMVEGHGNLQPQEHNGQVKLSLDRIKYGKVDVKEVRLAGIFGPSFAESSQLHVAAGLTTFDAALEWKENRLRLHDINLQQGTQQALSGYVSVPFEPQSKEPVPFEKRIAANINANQLDIEKLLATFGQTAPASGNVTANLVAGGTILAPSAHVKVAAKALKAKATPQLDAAEFDLSAHYAEKELTLDAVARQRDIQPLTIVGRVPLDLEAVLHDKKLDPDLPLDLTVKLPPTSLALLPKLVSPIRSSAGTVMLDAHVGGTVGKPQLSGSAGIKVEYARMKSEGVPAIGTLQGNLAFTQDSLAVQKFHGEIGGGTFDLSGKVQFPKITEPVFDLHLKSNSVLAMRNDAVTVRVDTDLAATGPLAAGKVAGTVWVTQSRFFKEIDILPIALPGRPKPEPRSVPSQGSFALGPPLSAWTFDIAIKTRPNDPFQIRGNLANGGASLDLKFGGTGAQPWLDGTVHIDNFVASLPFSKLNVTHGFVSFSKDAPFEPKLDLQAESTLRDYHITAYIYGGAKDPQLSLTSEPPLPQQDILSLLATGTTTSELTGNSDVLASRAAVLLFQQLYRKVFKKKDPAEGLPLADRFSVDVGAVDNRTGREEVSATFKLGEQLYLVGDVDVTGAFAGRVKYLLRFR